jgi:RimJ/RimL family protein N-acetyltransferase/L-amino acid N-acyltransferase YncA
LKTIKLRPAEPDRDFGQLAAWFTSFEDEPTSESQLKEYFEENKERTTHLVAEDEQGKLMGFYWTIRDRLVPDRASFDLFVKLEQRGQGMGSLLYEDLLHAVDRTQIKKLRSSIRDTCPECRAFAERRGFNEVRHHFGMTLDLDAFDDRPYDEVIALLKGEGFQFTSMEKLGNTEAAQRKLYALNDSASSTTPGVEGEHPWDSFADFQKRVCQSNWYKPGGQIVAIDTSTGAWAAMSAITRLEGNDYAYNLFTGVDMAYRGRKLGQAVKVLALRFARETLNTNKVHTHHNTRNAPMIAIDRKFGYMQTRGTFLMEKILE